MRHIEPITIDDVRAAQKRISSVVQRTPLVRLEVDGPAQIYLKLENLQPIGSFKLRGATNAIRSLPLGIIADGVYTASAGNMAQGVAWGARDLGVPCTVVMPDNAPETKVNAVKRLGANIVPLPFDDWWQTLRDHGREGMAGRFIHPGRRPRRDGRQRHDRARDPRGSAERRHRTGALRRRRPRFRNRHGGARATARARVSTGAKSRPSTPLTAALTAGHPVVVERTPSFVDGIGGRGVLEEMWPIVSDLVHGALVATLAETRAAIRLLVERTRVVAEGAGAVPVAAALAGRAGTGTIVCVVSGGNIDTKTLIDILNG